MVCHRRPGDTAGILFHHLAAVFFLRAWFAIDEPQERRRNALLAGVLLGISLYTKPTAGALVWGVLILLGAELLRTRFDLQRWMPRVTLAFWTGLACLPLGGIWYMRNILLGHEAITWPDAFWLTQARRSGDYLSWLVLAIIVAFALIALKRGLGKRQLMLGLVGIALILAAALASNPILFPERYDPPASYIQLQEEVALVGGLALLALSLREHLRLGASAVGQRAICIAALTLALPYFVTFFFSYSYHYRLGFAIVPLMILPAAAALSQLFSRDRITGWRPLCRRAYFVILMLLGIPGIVAVAVDVQWTRVWLFDRALDSDVRKYQVFNPSLMEVVFGLEDFQREADDPARILAPGEERLHFFFPQLTIIDRQVETLEDYQELDVTHFVYGAKARQSYFDAGIDPRETQLVAALGRRELFDLKRWHYDATFSYELYESGNMEGRYDPPSPSYVTDSFGAEVVFGDRLRLHAEDAFPQRIYHNTPITLRSVWQAIRPLEHDYLFELDLFNQDTGTVESQWVFALAEHRHGHYSTLLWEVDELVYDEHVFKLGTDAAVPKGDNYVFRLRARDRASEDYLAVTVDGIATGDSWQLDGAHSLRS